MQRVILIKDSVSRMALRPQALQSCENSLGLAAELNETGMRLEIAILDPSGRSKRFEELAGDQLASWREVQKRPKSEWKTMLHESMQTPSACYALAGRSSSRSQDSADDRDSAPDPG